MNNLLCVRDMLANHAMTELWDETRKLADKFGYEGAIMLLQAQIKFLRDVRNLIEDESEGEDNAV